MRLRILSPMKRLLAVAVLLAAACRAYEGRSVPRPYMAEIEKWRADRATRLKSESGWLSLVGLFWLQPGANDVKLPTNPPTTAHATLQDGKVTLDANPAFTIDGKPIAAPVTLVDDTDPKGPTVVKSGTLSFAAIKRGDVHGDRFALRARDPQSEARTNFKGLDYFPINPDFRVEARFEPYNPPKKIAITNVLGMTSDETSPGALVFNIGGKEYRIDPILEQGETDLFIIFKDQTSGHETYGAARYLYAHPADAGGKTIVDFNKAYNPPCTFTPYATCPLPPPQNRLPVRIEAGEKNYAGAHH
jgi:uncharacterized protein (DUF1684 family)